MKKPLFLFFVFALYFSVQAQESSSDSPILFIYDASGSMWGPMEGKTKKEIASTVLGSAVQSLPANQQIGLIAYGHRRKGDCEDIETLVELDNTDKAEVTRAVQGINPVGKTLWPDPLTGRFAPWSRQKPKPPSS